MASDLDRLCVGRWAGCFLTLAASGGEPRCLWHWCTLCSSSALLRAPRPVVPDVAMLPHLLFVYYCNTQHTPYNAVLSVASLQPALCRPHQHSILWSQVGPAEPLPTTSFIFDSLQLTTAVYHLRTCTRALQHVFPPTCIPCIYTSPCQKVRTVFFEPCSRRQPTYTACVVVPICLGAAALLYVCAVLSGFVPSSSIL